MSGLPFELLLGLRYLRPKRTFVSIITLISVLGVMLGVAVLIIVISVMSGFDSQLREKVLGFTGHLRIYQLPTETNRLPVMENYGLVIAKVKENPAVVSVTPLAWGPVMLETEPRLGEPELRAPILRGVEPEDSGAASLFTTNIPYGTNDLSGDGVLVGLDLSADLGVRVGDRVAVYAPEDLEKMWKHRDDTNGPREVIAPKDLEVRGIFNAGFYDYNENVIVTSLVNYQDLNHLDDNIKGLLVMLKDPFEAGRVRGELKQSLGDNYGIAIWTEESNQMAAVIVEKNVMMYILFFIVLVAAFGITCTQITFVVLKTREIGVLKALGANSRQVMSIFLSQSMMVSTLGVLAGLTGGLLALHYRNPFLHLMRRWTGMELFPQNIYNFSELPALINPGDIAVICGGSLVICLLAAAFPAWHASRLKPVEALRHE